MPPDPPIALDGDQSASSDDSDFAPDDAPDQADSESESGHNPGQQDPDAADLDQGYDNSGDEAIIRKGHKRRKGGTEEVLDDAREGGLIKTRRQRAQE